MLGSKKLRPKESIGAIPKRRNVTFRKDDEGERMLDPETGSPSNLSELVAEIVSTRPRLFGWRARDDRRPASFFRNIAMAASGFYLQHQKAATREQYNHIRLKIHRRSISARLLPSEIWEDAGVYRERLIEAS
jgi:hypothetical protein